jgi:hypothetical protein
MPKSYSASTLAIDIIDCKQDLFVYIITECYTPKEFYGVMIDINTSKKSTAGYRQYFAYKTTVNDNMDIDIM